MKQAISSWVALRAGAVGNELLIGLTLAIVVLPQAVAFSTTLAGLTSYFGLYCAVWGVLFTALLNPSRVFTAGPTAPSRPSSASRCCRSRRNSGPTTSAAR